MSPDIFLNFVLALLLGGLVGLERNMPSSSELVRQERDGHIWEESEIGGAGSYALLAFFGALMVWVDQILGLTFWVIMGFVVIAVMILIWYAYESFRKERLGITTELAGMITYMLGAVVMMEHYTVAAILVILILILLSGKDTIAGWSRHLSRQEFSNTLKFGIISLVVLPLLPNQSYAIADLFALFGARDIATHAIVTMKFINPFSIWLFVVIMAGVEYVGYILSKILGNRSGTVLSGAVGGLISSTAVTGAMTTKSHENTKNTYAFVAAVLIASMIMCVRVVIISTFYNPRILEALLLPAFAMLVGLGIMAWLAYRKDKQLSASDKAEMDGNYSSPFRLLPAMQFALIIVGVKFLAGVGLIYQDVISIHLFYYVLGMISGLADVDAITMDMAGKSADGTLSIILATSTILIATMSNNVVKAGIAYRFGEKTFGRQVAIGFGVSIIFGVLAIIFTNIVSSAL